MPERRLTPPSARPTEGRPALAPSGGERESASGTPPAEKREFAWQPLTPRGVAAFAEASFKRLFLVQFICALLLVGTVVWSFQQAWLPTISEAVRKLPTEGEIRAGRLNWAGDSPKRLAEGRFLALTVDLKNEGRLRSPAHVEVAFNQTGYRVFSLFGFAQGSYPQGWRVAFNRAGLEAWWGAWKPALSAMVVALLLAGVLLLWSALATLYCLPVWLAGFLANRDLGLGGSWRLSGAALMPGGVFLAAAISLYGMGTVDLIHLVLAFPLHILIGLGYVWAGVSRLSPHPEVDSGKGNPFAGASSK